MNECVTGAQASSQLAGEVAKVTDFLDTSRDQRRWAEEGARALQTQLRGVHKRMVEVKRGYEARCREEIQVSLAASLPRSSLCQPLCSGQPPVPPGGGPLRRGGQGGAETQQGTILTLHQHLL